MNLAIIKAVHTAMKEHLTNLLYQQYKQSLFFNRLKDAGITLQEVELIDNWNIIVDFIGFPKDNVNEWDWYNVNASTSQYPTDEPFNRSWLFQHYQETIKTITFKQNLVISNDGNVRVNEQIDTNGAKNILSSHVEWLFNEYEKFLEIAPV
jgi:hypothetical protein